MDILCHALESYTARWYADFDAKQPEQRVPYCGANPIADMWSEKALACWPGRSGRRCATARDARRARADGAGGDLRRPRLRQRRGAHPARQRLPDRRPGPRLPARRATPDEPMVPHGMAVVADRARGVPVHLRRRARAAPARRPAARPGGAATAPTRCPAVLATLMRDIGIPSGLAEIGYGEADVPDLVAGALQQQRLLATAPRSPTDEDLAAVFRGRWNTGDVTQTPPDLVAELRRRGISDVDDSTLTRALYSSDASLYRVVPQVVVRPRHPDELSAILDVSRETGAPVTMRGAGTSIAGNAVGTGIVVDTLKHLNKVVSIDAEARTAVVQPGVVHADLQRAAAPYGLRFGPDPSTHTRCTIGGMIGNNACGSRALGYGRTVDNVWRPRRRLRRPGAGDVRRPARGARPTSTSRTSARRSAGSAARSAATRWSTCCRRTAATSTASSSAPRARSRVVRGATVRLVEDDPDRHLVVLGYPVDGRGGRRRPCAARGGTEAMIGVRGPRLADRRPGRRARPTLPRGRRLAVRRGAGGRDRPRWSPQSGALEHRVVAGRARGRRAVADPRGRRRPGRASPVAAGVLRLGGRRGAARAPGRLAARLRRAAAGARPRRRAVRPLRRRLRARADRLPLRRRGSAVFRDFLTACAHKLREHGGSLSGEHGDGRARSELLSIMYDEESLALFGAVKAICDPGNLLNPGNIVDPAPLDADLRPTRPRHADQRRAEARPRRRGLRQRGAPLHRRRQVRGAEDQRRDVPVVPRDPRREGLHPRPVAGAAGGARRRRSSAASPTPPSARRSTSAWPARAARPTARPAWTWRRTRPRRCTRSTTCWARSARAATTCSAGCRSGRALRRADGAGRQPDDEARPGRPAGQGHGRHRPAALDPGVRAEDAAPVGRACPDVVPDVWIWADSFSDHFFPGNGHAAIRYLESVGVTARVIADDACCGLTWITTGQLDQARSIMERTVRTLTPYVESGRAGRRPGAVLPGDPAQRRRRADRRQPRRAHLRRAGRAARPAAARTSPAWRSSRSRTATRPRSSAGPPTSGSSSRPGATVTQVAGCCGLAGNFGMEKGHYEVSVAVAETHLLPAVRANPDAVVLADGMSCRVQLDDLAAASRRCTSPSCSHRASPAVEV